MYDLVRGMMATQAPMQDPLSRARNSGLVRIVLKPLMKSA
jgi:hypothetical protein